MKRRQLAALKSKMGILKTEPKPPTISNLGLPQIVKSQKMNNVEIDSFKEMIKFDKERRNYGISNFYQFRASINTTFRQSEQYMYGHEYWLTGYNNDDYSSIDVIMNVLDKVFPNAVVLGELSPYALNFIGARVKGQIPKFLAEPISFNSEKNKVFAKRQMREIYEKIREESYYYYPETKVDDYCIYRVDPLMKLKIAEPLLSAGCWAAGKLNIKIALAAPHPLLVHEDLCLNLSLDDLRYTFMDTLRTYQEQVSAMVNVPTTIHPYNIQNSIKEVAKSFHYQKLYHKRSLYMSSIIKKAIAVYNKSVILVENNYFDKFEKSFEEAPMGEESTHYRANFEESIEKLKSQGIDNALSETLEKLSLLGYLVGKDARNYIDIGLPIFSGPDALFGGIFSQIDPLLISRQFSGSL